MTVSPEQKAYIFNAFDLLIDLVNANNAVELQINENEVLVLLSKSRLDELIAGAKPEHDIYINTFTNETSVTKNEE